MANDYNYFSCVGRLGRDPEVRYMPNGDAAVNISLAVGESWKDKNSGEKKETTTWVPVSFFGKTAEIIGEYCKKGSQLLITGKFSVRKYTDQAGNEKTITEIKGDRMQLLGGKPDGGGGAPQQQRQAAPAQRAAAPARRNEPADDDIPF
jgi:single-strand DNA-binding protein